MLPLARYADDLKPSDSKRQEDRAQHGAGCSHPLDDPATQRLNLGALGWRVGVDFQ